MLRCYPPTEKYCVEQKYSLNLKLQTNLSQEKSDKFAKECNNYTCSLIIIKAMFQKISNNIINHQLIKMKATAQ